MLQMLACYKCQGMLQWGKVTCANMIKSRCRTITTLPEPLSFRQNKRGACATWYSKRGHALQMWVSHRMARLCQMKWNVCDATVPEGMQARA